MLWQEQAKAARARASGTMDEFTFVGEGSAQAGTASAAAAQQGPSAEQQYQHEMLQELQVSYMHQSIGKRSMTDIKHIARMPRLCGNT